MLHTVSPCTMLHTVSHCTRFHLVHCCTRFHHVQCCTWFHLVQWYKIMPILNKIMPVCMYVPGRWCIWYRFSGLKYVSCIFMYVYMKKKKSVMSLCISDFICQLFQLLYMSYFQRQAKGRNCLQYQPCRTTWRYPPTSPPHTLSLPHKLSNLGSEVET